MDMGNIRKVMERIRHIRERFQNFSNNFQKIDKNTPPPKNNFADILTAQMKKKVDSGVKTPVSINDIIEKYSKLYKVPPRLVKSIVKVESNFNPKAISKKGAQGLMQLMPQTSKELGVENPFNIEDNIKGGVKYLKQLLEANNGNIEKSIASYNAGFSNVVKYGGIPPFKETEDYVKKVLRHYYNNSDLW